MDITKAKLKLICPKCHASNTFTLNQAQKSEKLVCVGCSSEISLRDGGSVKKAQEEINQSLSEFSQKIKQVNDKLKIEIKI